MRLKFVNFASTKLYGMLISFSTTPLSCLNQTLTIHLTNLKLIPISTVRSRSLEIIGLQNQLAEILLNFYTLILNYSAISVN